MKILWCFLNINRWERTILNDFLFKFNTKYTILIRMYVLVTHCRSYILHIKYSMKIQLLTSIGRISVCAFQCEVTRVKRARVGFRGIGDVVPFDNKRFRLARDIGRRQRAIISASTTGDSDLRRGVPHMWQSATDSAYDMLKIRMLDYIGDTGWVLYTPT